jgi:hypothetical protein
MERPAVLTFVAEERRGVRREVAAESASAVLEGIEPAVPRRWIAAHIGQDVDAGGDVGLGIDGAAVGCSCHLGRRILVGSLRLVGLGKIQGRIAGFAFGVTAPHQKHGQRRPEATDGAGE